MPPGELPPPMWLMMPSMVAMKAGASGSASTASTSGMAGNICPAEEAISTSAVPGTSAGSSARSSFSVATRLTCMIACQSASEGESPAVWTTAKGAPPAETCLTNEAISASSDMSPASATTL